MWGGATSGSLHKIQKVMNFAARIISGSKKYDHITPVLNSLGWPKIESLVAERDAIKMFKALRVDGSPAAIKNLFVSRSDVSTRQTRASSRGELQLPAFHLTASQRSFRYRGAKLWNELPSAIVNCTSFASLKKAIAEHAANQHS